MIKKNFLVLWSFFSLSQALFAEKDSDRSYFQNQHPKSATEYVYFAYVENPIAYSEYSLVNQRVMEQSSINNNALASRFLMHGAISRTTPEGVGYCSSFTTFKLFFSNLTRPTNIFFLDGRLHLFDEGEMAANIGIGYRFKNHGLNFFYDSKQECCLFLNQIGFGYEYLNRLSVRANAYLPVPPQKSRMHTCRFDYTGGYFVEENIYTVPFASADLECELEIIQSPHIQFFAAAGPYFLKRHSCKEHYGAQGRLKLSVFFNLLFSCEFIASYDSIFKDIYQGRFTLYVPFTSFFGKSIFQIREVQRREILITHELCCWDWNY